MKREYAVNRRIKEIINENDKKQSAVDEWDKETPAELNR